MESVKVDDSAAARNATARQVQNARKKRKAAAGFRRPLEIGAFKCRLKLILSTGSVSKLSPQH
jgi:hypothetical protein